MNKENIVKLVITLVLSAAALGICFGFLNNSKNSSNDLIINTTNDISNVNNYYSSSSVINTSSKYEGIALDIFYQYGINENDEDGFRSVIGINVVDDISNYIYTIRILNVTTNEIIVQKEVSILYKSVSIGDENITAESLGYSYIYASDFIVGVENNNYLIDFGIFDNITGYLILTKQRSFGYSNDLLPAV